MRKNTIKHRDVPAKTQGKILTREDVLALLGRVISEQADKISHGRIRNAEKFTQRIRAIRALAYMVNIYLTGVKDEDVTEMLKKLEELEKLAADAK